jgi:hypothetical protein
VLRDPRSRAALESSSAVKGRVSVHMPTGKPEPAGLSARDRAAVAQKKANGKRYAASRLLLIFAFCVMAGRLVVEVVYFLDDASPAMDKRSVWLLAWTACVWLGISSLSAVFQSGFCRYDGMMWGLNEFIALCERGGVWRSRQRLEEELGPRWGSLAPEAEGPRLRVCSSALRWALKLRRHQLGPDDGDLPFTLASVGSFGTPFIFPSDLQAMRGAVRSASAVVVVLASVACLLLVGSAVAAADGANPRSVFGLWKFRGLPGWAVQLFAVVFGLLDSYLLIPVFTLVPLLLLISLLLAFHFDVCLWEWTLTQFFLTRGRQAAAPEGICVPPNHLLSQVALCALYIRRFSRASAAAVTFIFLSAFFVLGIVLAFTVSSKTIFADPARSLPREQQLFNHSSFSLYALGFK